QAEDGIRDKLVTGVQTCALPISPRTSTPICGPSGWTSIIGGDDCSPKGPPLPPAAPAGGDEQRERQAEGRGSRDRGRIADALDRSEERRVGKEGSARGWWCWCRA